jgi:hypothetical protein
VPSAIAPVPQGFDEWFARGTAREPAGRFQSAKELSTSLRALADKQSPMESKPDLQALVDPKAPVAAQTIPSQGLGSLGSTTGQVSSFSGTRMDARSSSNRKVVLGALAGGALLFVGLGVFFAWGTQESEPTEVTATPPAAPMAPPETPSPEPAAAPPAPPPAVTAQAPDRSPPIPSAVPSEPLRTAPMEPATKKPLRAKAPAVVTAPTTKKPAPEPARSSTSSQPAAKPAPKPTVDLGI